MNRICATLIGLVVSSSGVSAFAQGHACPHGRTDNCPACCRSDDPASTRESNAAAQDLRRSESAKANRLKKQAERLKTLSALCELENANRADKENAAQRAIQTKQRLQLEQKLENTRRKIQAADAKLNGNEMKLSRIDRFLKRQATARTTPQRKIDEARRASAAITKQIEQLRESRGRMEDSFNEITTKLDYLNAKEGKPRRMNMVPPGTGFKRGSQTPDGTFVSEPD
ncbi:MAG: hypothetical protein ACKVS9_19650 [Phycisphaerae bacterium]